MKDYLQIFTISNPWRFYRVNSSGFSTILAMLLTGFLITLTAGVLFLFLSENRINQSLFNGTAAYHAAEGSLEYALLKIKNHREGFEDELQLGEIEGGILAEGNNPRDAKIGYQVHSVGTSYTGVIASGNFEIIPLFSEKGKELTNKNGKPWKDPRSPVTLTSPKQFYELQKTSGFTAQILSGNRLVWNIIGNSETSGDTFGISGILYSSSPTTVSSGVETAVGNIGNASLGTFRTYNSGVLAETTKSIGNFMSSYTESYLVLFNPGDTPAEYKIISSDSTPFTFPKTQVVASGKVRDSLIRLQISEDKSRLYDILKYSLFVPE